MTTDTVRFDPTGFPMIWVPEIELFVHCLPVTKLQFERFLAAAGDGHFSDRWYQEVLRLNPRVSARRIWRDNYWQALMTGILPGETERFAAWCGDGYRLPREGEWLDLYRAMAARGPRRLTELGILDGAGPQQRELIENVERSVDEVCFACSAGCNLPERLLLRLGAVEWVAVTRRGERSWAGLGEPHPSFCGNLFSPEDGQAVLLADPEGERLASFGFRLAFDPQLAQDTAERTGSAAS